MNKYRMFTAPNGEVIECVVFEEQRHFVGSDSAVIEELCYAQNRIFRSTRRVRVEGEDVLTETILKQYVPETLVAFCVIPEFDDMLAAKQ